MTALQGIRKGQGGTIPKPGFDAQNGKQLCVHRNVGQCHEEEEVEESTLDPHKLESHGADNHNHDNTTNNENKIVYMCE